MGLLGEDGGGFRKGRRFDGGGGVFWWRRGFWAFGGGLVGVVSVDGDHWGAFENLAGGVVAG